MYFYYNVFPPFVFFIVPGLIGLFLTPQPYPQP